jgi:hypothetical protein
MGSISRSRPMTRRALAFAALVAVSLVTEKVALGQDTVVVQWNKVLLQAVRDTRFAPMFAARALAIVHTSMYDAWAAYEPMAVGTR